MGKYFTVRNGEVYDWKWRRYPAKAAEGWVFLLGTMPVGVCFKSGEGDWCAVSYMNHHSLCPVSGFRSRHAAAEFLLKFLDKEEDRR